MKYKNILKLNSLISIYADEYQYILIIKENDKQLDNNAKRTYHQSLSGCFEEILFQTIKNNLSNKEIKTISELADELKSSSAYIRNLLTPFESLK